ncbi:WD repeat-containing protein 54-like isoform X2 [Pomacea canaliculata]|uniref:WD repeat-containing protein 54-like isoform X2 n=1 Tax=Pomacea canaliculata TaxID=400727 RepID=UPI000D739E76|nr:WD repeat-containing protein 54-like isoform X2 [Pomacea canaliculata]
MKASTDGANITAKQVVCKEPSATQGNPFLTQAKWVKLTSRCVLVLTTQKGIQIFEPDGSAMIYWHGLGDTSDASVNSNFARGVTGVEDILCVGTESGKILVFRIPSKGTDVTLQSTLKGHSCSICDLASKENIVVSGDSMGNILVWKFNGSNSQQVTSIPGSGSPCNSLGLWKDVLVAGYGSGHLRVFSASTGKLAAEATAHARTINAIDIATDNGLVLSVSDDSFLRLWQIRLDKSPRLEYKHAENVTDIQLTGGKFVDAQGRALCLTGYDHNEIIFYVKS